MSFETITATGPNAWAPYLVNGDASGLEGDEIAAADEFVTFIGAGAPVDCTERGFMAYSNARDWGMIHCAADCCEYTFLKHSGEST